MFPPGESNVLYNVGTVNRKIYHSFFGLEVGVSGKK